MAGALNLIDSKIIPFVNEVSLEFRKLANEAVARNLDVEEHCKVLDPRCKKFKKEHCTNKAIAKLYLDVSCVCDPPSSPIKPIIVK